ncbi:NYN domain-containing protein [Agarilytica rhodophyticola]|uniref:NYN domain-containing protein n=1 Tax=Agarilytica rhodophyticola TaxID=1737490 RepID=UPI000CD976EB|nr:NYN domain-containing protein [Agarilytica rhodophyticola]
MKIAVLIDADNIGCNRIGELFAILSEYGNAVIKRAYGDWSSLHSRGWKDTLNQYGIRPVQQFAYTPKKNASDMALVVDAMDLLHQGDLDMFVIVSSDSDFTRLAARLRESQKFVLGCGYVTTPKAFQQICDAFTFLEPKQATRPHHSQDSDVDIAAVCIEKSRLALNDKRLIETLVNIVKKYSDEEGWAPISVCGSFIRRHYPHIQYKKYGCKTLTELIEATQSFTLFKPSQDDTVRKQIYIRNNLPLIKLSTRTWI